MYSITSHHFLICFYSRDVFKLIDLFENNFKSLNHSILNIHLNLVRIIFNTSNIGRK